MDNIKGVTLKMERNGRERLWRGNSQNIVVNGMSSNGYREIKGVT